jgi:hypothetical protein
MVLQAWTLIMGYTLEEQPIIGEAPAREELRICAGFHDHGENTRSLGWGLLTIDRHGIHFPICTGISTIPSEKRRGLMSGCRNATGFHKPGRAGST